MGESRVETVGGGYAILGRSEPAFGVTARVLRAYRHACERAGDAEILVANDPFVEMDATWARRHSCVARPLSHGDDGTACDSPHDADTWCWTWVGQDLISYFGIDATGKTIEEVYRPELVDDTVSIYTSVATPPYDYRCYQVRYEADDLPVPGDVTENLFLPFRTEKGNVWVFGTCAREGDR